MVRMASSSAKPVRYLVVGALVLVTVVVATLVLRNQSCSDGSKVHAVPTDQIRKIATAVTSGSAQEVSTVLAAPIGASGHSAAESALLPSGAKVRIDEAHEEVDGGTARVPVTVTGPGHGRWYLLLVREGTQWKLYGTARR